MEQGAVQRVIEQFQQLGLTLPDGPTQPAWRDFIIEMYRRVEAWEEQERRNFRPSVWDFSVIYSTRDAGTAEAFKRLVETSLGLYGRLLGELEYGDRTLEAAEAMIEGSTKVFVLATRHLSRIDVPRFIYQDVLMEELRKEKWRCKMIPLFIEGDTRIPFGLRNIRGIVLRDDPSTAQMVNRAIPLEAQMEVRAARRSSERLHEERMRRLRTSRLQEIKEVVVGLRQRFGDDYDPTLQLDQMTEALRSMTVSDVPGTDQLVNINNCTNITVGPSIHFTVRCDDANSSEPSTQQPSTTYTQPSTSNSQSSQSYQTSTQPSNSSQPSTFNTQSSRPNTQSSQSYQPSTQPSQPSTSYTRPSQPSTRVPNPSTSTPQQPTRPSNFSRPSTSYARPSQPSTRVPNPSTSTPQPSTSTQRPSTYNNNDLDAYFEFDDDFSSTYTTSTHVGSVSTRN